MSVLAYMNHTLTTNYDSNKYSMVIQTNLSAAFDTVDHNILLHKLEYYGIRGKENQILRSFLEDRRY